MSSRSMNLEVIVRLQDMMSAGISGIEKKLQSFGQSAQKAFHAADQAALKMANGLHGAAQKIGRGIDGLANKLGALGIGASFGAGQAIQKFADWEDRLTEIAITADKSGKAAKAFVNEYTQMIRAATEEAGQPATKLAESFGKLVANGIPEQVAAKMFIPIGQAARAMHAEVADATNLATVFQQVMGIKPENLTKAFAITAKAGKEGEFEAKDMARLGPSAFAAAAAGGTKGERGISIVAAMLETSRKTTATAGEAETNIRDMFANFRTKHFKDRAEKYFKIDVEKIQQNAVLAGIDPNEATVSAIFKRLDTDKGLQTAIKKSEASIKKRATELGSDPETTRKVIQDDLKSVITNHLLGQGFVNQQAFQGIASLYMHRDFYKETRDKAAAAGPDMIKGDMQTSMGTARAKLDMLQDKADKLATKFGEHLAPAIDKFDWGLGQINKGFDALNNTFPKLTSVLVQGITAVGAALGAIAGFNLVNGIARGGPAAVGTGGGLLAGTGNAMRLLARGGLYGVAAYGGYKLGEGLHEVGQIAGGRHWTPGDKEGVWALKKELEQTEGKISGILDRSHSSMRGQFNPDVERLRGEAQNLRNRITAGERLNTLSDMPGIGSGRSMFGFGRGGTNAVNGPMQIPTLGVVPGAPKPAPPPPQEVKVGGSITVKVDGPGQITNASTVNSNVPINADRGTTALRP